MVGYRDSSGYLFKEYRVDDVLVGFVSHRPDLAPLNWHARISMGEPSRSFAEAEQAQLYLLTQCVRRLSQEPSPAAAAPPAGPPDYPLGRYVSRYRGLRAWRVGSSPPPWWVVDQEPSAPDTGKDYVAIRSYGDVVHVQVGDWIVSLSDDYRVLVGVAASDFERDFLSHDAVVAESRDSWLQAARSAAIGELEGVVGAGVRP